MLTRKRPYEIILPAGDVMSSETEDNAVLDGIGELMLIPIKSGETKKVEAQITLEVDDKDGKMKVSALINSEKPKKK